MNSKKTEKHKVEKKQHRKTEMTALEIDRLLYQFINNLETQRLINLSLINFTVGLFNCFSEDRNFTVEERQIFITISPLSPLSLILEDIFCY